MLILAATLATRPRSPHGNLSSFGRFFATGARRRVPSRTTVDLIGAAGLSGALENVRIQLHSLRQRPEAHSFSRAAGPSVWACHTAVSARTSGPRGSRIHSFCSLTGPFSPNLCTMPVWYRASRASIDGHSPEAEFKSHSLHRVRSCGPPRVGVPNPLPVTTATSEGVDQRRG
jgi:hypothetical protein